jgi:hypothetical protein
MFPAPRKSCKSGHHSPVKFGISPNEGYLTRHLKSIFTPLGSSFDLYPLGVKLPPGVNEGVNNPPRILSSPLDVKLRL